MTLAYYQNYICFFTYKQLIMKLLAIYLAMLSLLLLQSLQAQNTQVQKEVEKTIQSLVEYSVDKNLDKSMSFWSDSDDFTYIADGKQLNFTELKQVYSDYFQNREQVKIISQSYTVHAINQYNAICIWEGTEKVKMKDQDETVVNWIATLIMENKKGGWVITHGHTSHF